MRMIHKGVKTFLSGNINIIDSITLRVIYIKYMLCNYDMSYSFGNNLISEVRVLCIALLNNCLYIFWSNFFVCAFNTFLGVWKEQKYVSLLLQQFCFLSYLSIIILISIFPWFYMYTMQTFFIISFEFYKSYSCDYLCRFDRKNCIKYFYQ